MNKILMASIIALISTPVVALDDQKNKDHSMHEMHHGADHDHEEHDHDDHAADNSTSHKSNGEQAVITKTDEILAALGAGGEPVVVDILGVVCDFCAKAMNKTFGKREEVAATYVDLDTKAMSLVFNPGVSLDDETINKLVKKSGYRAAAIRRGDIALNGGGDATDPS